VLSICNDGKADRSGVRLLPRFEKAGSKRETTRVPWVRPQLFLISNWAARENVVVADWVFATPTYRKSAFTLVAEFRAAVDRANRDNGSLVLADIAELLCRTHIDHIPRCVDQLLKAGVPVVDATSGREWSSHTTDELNSITLQAGAARNARSRAVKDGLTLAGKQGSAPPKSNGNLGALAQSNKADRAALQLAEFVRSELAKLPPDDRVSLSALARALNDAGHPAPRSKAWSHNSTKNLIRRLVVLNRL
jgi:hypothetical protein